MDAAVLDDVRRAFTGFVLVGAMGLRVAARAEEHDDQDYDAYDQEHGMPHDDRHDDAALNAF